MQCLPIKMSFSRLSRQYITFKLCGFCFNILRFQGYLREISSNYNPDLIKQNVLDDAEIIYNILRYAVCLQCKQGKSMLLLCYVIVLCSTGKEIANFKSHT